MGLDMYLTARRYLFEYEPQCSEIKAKIDAVLATSLGSAKEVAIGVGYWRKANAIHRWFVDNVQDGVDNCQETWLERTDLEKLLIVVDQALENRELAGQILPPGEGFFFGSTDLDEYYFQDLEDTKRVLEKIINAPDFKDWDFYYRASW